MPPVEFEPTIPAGERPQTYALDRAATGTGISFCLQNIKFLKLYLLLSPGKSIKPKLISQIIICPVAGLKCNLAEIHGLNRPGRKHMCLTLGETLYVVAPHRSTGNLLWVYWSSFPRASQLNQYWRRILWAVASRRYCFSPLPLYKMPQL